MQTFRPNARRREAAAAILCVFVLVAAAVFSAEPAVYAAEKIVFGFKGIPDELRLAQQFVEEFNRQHPDIEVEILDMTASGDSWPERLAVLFASGTAPDVIRMEYQRSFPFVNRGLLLPLDRYADTDPAFDRLDFFEASLEAHTVDGVLYGIPREAQPFTVFINETRVAEVGLPFPDLDWDMDTFLEIARRTRRLDDEGFPLRYGWHMERSVTRLMPFLNAYGGGVYDQAAGRFTVTDPGTIQALDVIQQAALEPGVVGGDFRYGQASLFLRGPWMVPEFRQTLTDFEWNIMPAPGGPGGRGTTLGSDAYYISKDSRHPDLAWEFVKHMTGEAAAMRLAASGGVVPARREVARQYILSGSSEPPHNLEAYLVGLEIARPTPNLSEFVQIERVLEAQWQRVFIGAVDARTAMEEILPQLEALAGQ